MSSAARHDDERISWAFCPIMADRNKENVSAEQGSGLLVTDV
ncbi:hypothetical protein [Enterovibrio norvegicus]|nr:hypothetical protein [Enterovibrio norvegicus]